MRKLLVVVLVGGRLHGRGAQAGVRGCSGAANSGASARQSAVIERLTCAENALVLYPCNVGTAAAVSLLKQRQTAAGYKATHPLTNPRAEAPRALRPCLSSRAIMCALGRNRCAARARFPQFERSKKLREARRAFLVHVWPCSWPSRARTDQALLYFCNQGVHIKLWDAGAPPAGAEAPHSRPLDCAARP